MRFHDIELHNVRAIDSLSITGLAERGVVVISGENESGKTTIAKAIHVALTTKWKSRSSEALSLNSHSSQEKPQVKLRLELDGYEFTLDKIFGSTKDTGTIVTVHSPTAEVLKDDQAEEWLAARMHNADTKNLWQVFVAEQGQAQKTLSLGGYAQVTSALQSASGQRAETAEEVGLFEAVEAEYGNYFQKNGKERKQLTDVDKELAEAQQVRDEAAKKVREFEALNEEAARNEESQHTQRASLPEAKNEVEHWAQALEELEKFRVAVSQAQEVSAAAKQQLDLAKQAQQERETFIQQAQDAKDQHSVAEKRVAELKEAFDKEVAALKKAQEDRDAVVTAYREARKAEELAAAEVALGEKRGLVEALSKRVEKLDALRAQLAEQKEVIARNSVTEEVMEKLLTCEREVATATAVLEASSPSVQLSASSAQEVTVDGEKVGLAPEAETVQRAVTKPLAIEVGDVTVAIQPGDGSDSQQRKLEKAEISLKEQLEAAGADSVAEAQKAYARRREAEKAKFQVETSITAVSDGVEYHQLTAELDDAKEEARVQGERYRELAGEDAPTEIDLVSAKSRLEKAAGGRRDAESERDNADIRLSKLEKRPAHANYTKASSELEGARSVLKVREDSLTTAREKASDAEIFAAVENRGKDYEAAEEQLAAALKELAQRDADDVEASLAGAKQRRDAVENRLAELEKRRQEIRVHLDYFDSANEKLAAAEGVVERTQRDRDSMRRRAAAAKTLMEVMTQARAASRNALADPLLRKLEEYGGGVFGAGTQFTMNEDLQIESRSNADGKFDVDELSGGAQEQLDILLRLAVAGVMEGGQGAPVIIDDALGYSDEHRLRRMNNALAKAGRDMQVLVLTCDEARFDRVTGAEFMKIQDLVSR
ncbi:AAA family ATPase [Corynebacterium sp. MSK151]|uniref:ATP-binding protein n=1 Tax=unclassified Corynebacterium TaxID=2624378 RepID=UPI00254C4F67|nr:MULTISPECIES: AAA family ATPase [unclassified Corynebacterium]MDK8758366.1 AAA family ATPase [Corynebacterium sp. MSK151]MDK8847309.1 AAA family ATPase [Corynebacterium sp. MSK047]